MSIAALLDQLTPDPWRATIGFSPELDGVQNALWAASSEDEAGTIIREWLRRHQPCLFGRLAAKEGLLTLCVLSELDLQRSDEHIRDRIQAARTQWTREAFEGRKSGFVIAACSRGLALATPGSTVQAIARRLASLYLLEEIQTDKIYLEEVFLEMPSHRRTTWRWSAGVNYFAAHADRRWWNDHRFPGGVALSVNSVGHMAKSGQIGGMQQALESSVDAPADGWLPTKVDSLHQALEFAMRTIAMASDTISGPATYLLPASETGPSRCPIQLPPNLAGKDCREYEGFYHTDVTLPSAYFRPDVERPVDTAAQRLDFTYLFDESVDNPDHVTTGTGRRIRSAAGPGVASARATSGSGRSKMSRATPTVIDIASSARLRAAL